MRPAAWVKREKANALGFALGMETSRFTRGTAASLFTSGTAASRFTGGTAGTAASRFTEVQP